MTDDWEGVTTDSDGNVTKLILSDKKIPRLPASIDKLDCLQVLEVEECALERLPNSIGNLQSLDCTERQQQPAAVAAGLGGKACVADPAAIFKQ